MNIFKSRQDVVNGNIKITGRTAAVFSKLSAKSVLLRPSVFTSTWA